MDNYEEEDEDECISKSGTKASNVLPLWGNERTMNLNPLILTNIQSSHYFKVNLYELKTYHEVVDEIYYKVAHLEPWEKGSRRTSGQTGMCGGVRGVGAGGIVSTAYCLLYKLYTLKLTRKQLNGLISHCDSPYIRALGFMYIRYVLPPANLLDWYEPYFEDEEEMDVKAGGGQTMKLGNILRQWLVKLEWFSTLFPRIPVPIQQKIQRVLEERYPVPVVAPIQQQSNVDRGGPGNFNRGNNYADGHDNRGNFSGNRNRPTQNDNFDREQRRGADGDRSRDRSQRYQRDRSPHSSHHRDTRDKHRDNRDKYKDRREREHQRR